MGCKTHQKFKKCGIFFKNLASQTTFLNSFKATDPTAINSFAESLWFAPWSHCPVPPSPTAQICLPVTYGATISTLTRDKIWNLEFNSMSNVI